MVGPGDDLPEFLLQLGLAGEAFADGLGGAVEDLDQRHAVLEGVVRRLGLHEEIAGEELVD